MLLISNEGVEKVFFPSLSCAIVGSFFTMRNQSTVIYSILYPTICFVSGSITIILYSFFFYSPYSGVLLFYWTKDLSQDSLKIPIICFQDTNHSHFYNFYIEIFKCNFNLVLWIYNEFHIMYLISISNTRNKKYK